MYTKDKNSLNYSILFPYLRLNLRSGCVADKVYNPVKQGNTFPSDPHYLLSSYFFGREDNLHLCVVPRCIHKPLFLKECCYG